jgi:hypothetical protein
LCVGTQDSLMGVKWTWVFLAQDTKKGNGMGYNEEGLEDGVTP